jgi:hypothetical protein
VLQLLTFLMQSVCSVTDAYVSYAECLQCYRCLRFLCRVSAVLQLLTFLMQSVCSVTVAYVSYAECLQCYRCLRFLSVFIARKLTCGKLDHRTRIVEYDRNLLLLCHHIYTKHLYRLKVRRVFDCDLIWPHVNIKRWFLNQHLYRDSNLGRFRVCNPSFCILPVKSNNCFLA